MKLDVVLLPRDLTPAHLEGRAVVVFDVLRATTTMLAALDAGAKEIRVFGGLDAVREAFGQRDDSKLLCGELKTIRPNGFDLGNSPGDYSAERVAGKTLFLSTTNGTRAIVAAAGARELYAAALVNRAAMARRLAERSLDVTLLCASTDGHESLEDLLGAGAVINALNEIEPPSLDSDVALMAARLFTSARGDLPGALRSSLGGRNVIASGLEKDIHFAALLDTVAHVARVVGPAAVVRLE